MDVLVDVLDRVRLGGTLLYHFELGRPWSLLLPQRPYALFHYLGRGTATLVLDGARECPMKAGDFVVLPRGEPHAFYSDRGTSPVSVLDLGLDGSPAHLGVVRHGGTGEPISTMICGKFTLSRPSQVSVLDLLPPVLLLNPAEDNEWLEAILRRIVTESARERPGRDLAISRLTEVLFIEVLRSWIGSLRPGEGGWLGAMADPHIGPALQLIHERPDRPWTLEDLGQRVGLGRSAFSARFTKLVGQSMYRYLTYRRMEQAALLLESSDDGVARVAARVGYETIAAFSKAFLRYRGLSPGRYRAIHRSHGGRIQGQNSPEEVSEQAAHRSSETEATKHPR